MSVTDVNTFVKITWDTITLIKHYHFQCKKISTHQLMDKYFEELHDLFDELAEILQGIYGKITSETYTTDLKLWKSHSDASNALVKYKQTLVGWTSKLDESSKGAFKEVRAKVDEVSHLIDRKNYLLGFE
jgi:DNA-binding ferritin-like protein